MRVLWLHQNLVTGAQAGNGRAGYTAAALLEAGHTVDLVAADHTYLGERIDEPAVQTEGQLTLRRVPVDVGSKGRAYASFAARSLAVAGRLPRPDLVFLSTPPLPGAIPSLLWARARGCPVVAEIRDLWPGFLVEGGLLQPGMAVRGLELLELAVLHAAAEVISVSPGFTPYLADLGCAPVVSVTGCDPTLAEPRAPRGERSRVVYTGSLNEAYGIGLLLDLIAARPDIDWVIAGTGRGRRAVEEAAERPQLTYLGPVPRADVPALLASADVAVNLHADWPLLGTTLTGKLFDYLACGVAVLDLAGGQMARLVERAGAGVTSRRDPDAASAALDEVLADAQAMGERGRTFGLAHLDAPTEARRVAQIVERAASHPRPRLRSVAQAMSSIAPARRLRAVYGADPGAVAAAALDAWLDGRTPGTQAPLRIPRLLGGR